MHDRLARVTAADLGVLGAAEANVSLSCCMIAIVMMYPTTINSFVAGPQLQQVHLPRVC
jgi:hypothetical protein